LLLTNEQALAKIDEILPNKDDFWEVFGNESKFVGSLISLETRLNLGENRLAPYDFSDRNYMKDVLTGKKAVLSEKEVAEIKVPRFKELDGDFALRCC
jgi:hypothetical protein